MTSTIVNCLLVGAPGVGKTSFYWRHKTGHFYPDPPTQPVPGVLTYSTSQGEITFVLWEGVVPPKVDCSLLFFSVTDSKSYTAASSLFAAQTARFGRIPTVLCGNKVDAKDRQVSARKIDLHRQVGIPYCNVSTKSLFDYDHPLLFLARQILRDPTLTFTVAHI